MHMVQEIREAEEIAMLSKRLLALEEGLEDSAMLGEWRTEKIKVSLSYSPTLKDTCQLPSFFIGQLEEGSK